MSLKKLWLHQGTAFRDNQNTKICSRYLKPETWLKLVEVSVLMWRQSSFHFDFPGQTVFNKGESPQKVVLFRPKQNLWTPSCKYLRQLLHPETCYSSAAVSFLDVKNEQISEETQQKTSKNLHDFELEKRFTRSCQNKGHTDCQAFQLRKFNSFEIGLDFVLETMLHNYPPQNDGYLRTD